MKMKLAALLFGALLASTSLFAANGSCGAGKCGGEMKNDMSKMNNDMKDMKKDMKQDIKGSCGNGKCGSK